MSRPCPNHSVSRSVIAGVFGLFVFLLFSVVPLTSMAATRTWTGANSNQWSDDGAGGNWRFNQVAPVSGDVIEYDANSTARLSQTNDIVGLTNMMIHMDDNPSGNVTISGNEIGIADGARDAVSTDFGTGRQLTINAKLRLDGDSTIYAGGFQIIRVDDVDTNGFGLTLDGGGWMVWCKGVISGSGNVTYKGGVDLREAPTYTGRSILENFTDVTGLRSLPSSSAMEMRGASVYYAFSSTTVASLSDDGSGNSQIRIRSGRSFTTGGDDTSTSYSGRFTDSGALIKTGSGTMTLSGNSTNTGAVQLNGGALVISGTMASTSYSLASGTTLRLGADERLGNSVAINLPAGATFDLDGNSETIGSLSGAGTVSTGAGTLTIATSLSPGTSPGVITIGNFDISGGTLNAEIDGANPGTGYDQITATGSVTLGGNLNLNSTHSPTIGDTFVIINKTSAGVVTGTFNGLPEGSTISSGGTTYRISYAGGTNNNDVVLTALTGIKPPTPTPTPTPEPKPEPEPAPDPRPAPEITPEDSPNPTGSLNGPTISWPKVGGTNHYNIYRAACPTCPKTKVGRVPGTSFTDESALPGQVYYYFVRSDNGALSDYSDWVPAWRYEQNPGRAGDFNADGIMDLLWWNLDTNQLSIWFMNGGEVQSVSTPVDGLYISQWLLVNTGDFNADGFWDLLWWNPATGEVVVWYMTAQSALAESFAPNAATVEDITGNATLSYAGDLNGDGRADVVWRDYATGQVTIWLLGDDGAPVLNGPPALADGMADDGRPGVTDSLEWTLCGLHDMDGDGKADLVWQHATDGRVVVWRMDGSEVLGLNEYQREAPENWRVAGLGDLNGGGLGDIAWRNDLSGQVQAWLMIGNDPAYEQQEIAMGEDTVAWQVKAVGDFCTAGIEHLYCKHTESGAARIVTLNGQVYTPNVP